MSQTLVLLSFCYPTAVYLLRRSPTGRESRAELSILVLPGLLVGLYAGSKDFVVAIILAALLGGMSQRESSRRPRRFRHAGIILLIAGVLFVVFPVISAYRLAIKQSPNINPVRAATMVPSILSEDNYVFAVPKMPGDHGMSGYIRESLEFTTNRLNGWDDMAIVTAAPRDRSYLPGRFLVGLPLTAFLPQRVLGSPGDVGLLFAHQYWGLSPSDPTHIAIGAPSEGYLTYGLVGLILISALFGVVSGLADGFARKHSAQEQLLFFTLSMFVLGLERDLGLAISTLLRRLILIFLIGLWIRSRDGVLPPRRPLSSGVPE